MKREVVVVDCCDWCKSEIDFRESSDWVEYGGAIYCDKVCKDYYDSWWRALPDRDSNGRPSSMAWKNG